MGLNSFEAGHLLRLAFFVGVFAGSRKSVHQASHIS